MKVKSQNVVVSKGNGRKESRMGLGFPSWTNGETVVLFTEILNTRKGIGVVKGT